LRILHSVGARGEVVTRKNSEAALVDDTFVDFDHSLNTANYELREARERLVG